MTVFQLDPSSFFFPDPSLADRDGLLAVGGDLSPERLLHAYSQGIFPWYNENTPILWWSPDPRCVLFPKDLHIPRSLHKVIRKNFFSYTLDTCFSRVIRSCSQERSDGTWLVPDMVEAYCRLHDLGYAHSVEVWHENELAGGLYGVSLGRIFFGESMFFLRPNASKAALVYLTRLASALGMHFIDCQQTTDNLVRFGARPVPRHVFLSLSEQALNFPTHRGSWSQKGAL